MQMAEVDIDRMPQDPEIRSAFQDSQVGVGDMPKYSGVGDDLYRRKVGDRFLDIEVVFHGALSQEVAGAEESQ